MTDESSEPNREKAPSGPGGAVHGIVGIGASAGGLDALQAFFPAVTPECGVTFVVVQHLDPGHRSSLGDLLARCSKLPVTVIETETAAEPNHVYVIPPNAALTIRGGRLRLGKPTAERGFRTPVDSFLVSLAQDQGENAACVILSGTGSDGTLGLRAIKEHGGLTLAQTSDSAEYDGMMRSAVATGLVDFILPPEEMPAKLVDHFRHMSRTSGIKGRDGIRLDARDHLGQICALLKARTGHDFSNYKDKTVTRRIQRRMQVLQIDRIPDYIERLRNEPGEADLLLQDMLIGVTSFFRDAGAFDALEREVIPKLFEGKGPDDTVRVWVPGCATGEEAYSIAILLREHTPTGRGAPKLQVFATDIDDHALAVARLGRYPVSIAQDVPPKRLERYFLREDGTYRAVSELREICLFSAHDLLRDPPFSKLDLISCRNLLIYLNLELQNRIVPLFHYALRDNGYLFLGTSENVTRHSRLFATVHKASRIFQRRPRPDRSLPEFPLVAADTSPHPPVRTARPAPADDSLRGLAERQLLDHYAPAYVVIDGDGSVLQSSGRTGKYLELPPGAPELNVFGMARHGLRLELRAAVHRALRDGRTAVQRNVSIDANGGRQVLNLIVQPLRKSDSSDSLYMVVFQDVGGIRSESGEPSAETGPDTESATRQLETELRETRERLQTSTEELETSNEELETSREELQSINEELQTVNAELSSRVEELSRAHSDIANLLENTQIATVFLDRDLTVKSFTPAAKDVFRLVESDTGRPITHVRARFAYDLLQEDAERVLRTLGTVERQVESSDGDALYVMRILPYRTVDNSIGGVVITFTDITRMAAAESQINKLTRNLRERLENLKALVDLVPVAIFIAEDRDSREVRVNRYGASLLGGADGRKGLRQIATRYRVFEGDRELAPDEQPLQRAARSGEAVPSFEGRLVRADGSTAEVLLSAIPLFDEGGKPRGAVAAAVDISHQKWSAMQQDVLLHELQHRVKNILATITSLAARMVKTSDTKEQFSEAFIGRLMAMGRTHNLLSSRNWEGAGLRPLITSALEPYATDNRGNIRVDGPEILLTPNAASTLGMVLHELATNAAKYGALSAPHGRVELAWRIEGPPDGEQLQLTWVEHDGPRVAPPRKDGFGTGFVKRSMEYELEGTAELGFEPGGLSCTIMFPLRGSTDRRRASVSGSKPDE